MLNYEAGPNDKVVGVEFKFILEIKTPKLNLSHYSPYQQKLFRLIKFLKEKKGMGYRRISDVLTNKGFVSYRSKSILKPNYIYSIYKRGKAREQRYEKSYSSLITNPRYRIIFH